MSKLPVTRNGTSESETLMIDTGAILHIEQNQDGRVVVHTLQDRYILDLRFNNIEQLLFEDGFRMAGKSQIINMNNVLEYDPGKHIAYLGHPSFEAVKTAAAGKEHREHIEALTRMLQTANPQEWWQQHASETADPRLQRSAKAILEAMERTKMEQRIIHMAFHDDLTNLPNRVLLNKRLQELFLKAEAAGDMLAVIFLDLDRFKIINDTLGHFVGDWLLKEVTNRLLSYVPEHDIIARFSGDEFIIVLSGIGSSAEVTTFAEGLTRLFIQPFVYENQDLFVTASAGISLYPMNGTDEETLIRNADTAMYVSKEKGGDTFHLYRPEMNKRSMERLNLETNLRKALERNEITLYYQPLVELQTGSLYGMESLVRWNHPQLGMVSPSDFIPMAEESGLIVPIGNWVLRQACEQTRLWQRMGFNHLIISVNISVNQLQQNDFLSYIRSTLEETGLEPERLYLEITEHVAMKNVSYISDTMDALREMGVQISIDDFGTGYSSLSYLKRFPVHTLKIDQSFIRDITTDEDNAAIVTALIAMSRQLKIKSLAEGVETIEQLEFLRDQGCDEIQGYVYSRPVPPEQFEVLLKENRTLYVS